MGYNLIVVDFECHLADYTNEDGYSLIVGMWQLNYFLVEFMFVFGTPLV